MVKKFLLFYCTVLALFMNLSGLAAAKQTQDYFLQAAFLPITLFLLYSSFSLIFKKKGKLSETPPAGKPLAAIILLCLLFSLTLLARLTINNSQIIVSPLPDNPKIISTPSPTPTIFIPQTITIMAENPKFLVNIREKPASDSAVLAKTKSGVSFPCLQIKEGWYLIKMKTGKEGWVYGEFVIPKQE